MVLQRKLFLIGAMSDYALSGPNNFSDNYSSQIKCSGSSLLVHFMHYTKYPRNKPSNQFHIKVKMLMACHLQHCTVGSKSSRKQRKIMAREKVSVEPNTSLRVGAGRFLPTAYLGFPSVALCQALSVALFGRFPSSWQLALDFPQDVILILQVAGDVALLEPLDDGFA